MLELSIRRHSLQFWALPVALGAADADPEDLHLEQMRVAVSFKSATLLLQAPKEDIQRERETIRKVRKSMYDNESSDGRIAGPCFSLP